MATGVLEGIEFESKRLYGLQTKILDDEQRIVEAIVAVTGIEDKVKDIIHPGAFARTLRERTPVGCWSHKWDQPVIRTIECKELMPGDARLPDAIRAKGGGALAVKGQFFDTQAGRDAYTVVKDLIRDIEWSIGYVVPRTGAEYKDGRRHIRDVDTYEYSPVIFGAHPLTGTMSLKSAEAALRLEHKDMGIGTDSVGGPPMAPRFGSDGQRGDAEGHEHSHDHGDGAGPHSHWHDHADGDYAHTGDEHSHDHGHVKADGKAEGPWDADSETGKLRDDTTQLRAAYAWHDPDGDPDAKSSYKFPHHFVSGGGKVGAASAQACSAGIAILNGARGGADIGGSKESVYRHLAAHLREAGRTPPELKALVHDGSSQLPIHLEVHVHNGTAEVKSGGSKDVFSGGTQDPVTTGQAAPGPAPTAARPKDGGGWTPEELGIGPNAGRGAESMTGTFEGQAPAPGGDGWGDRTPAIGGHKFTSSGDSDGSCMYCGMGFMLGDHFPPYTGKGPESSANQAGVQGFEGSPGHWTGNQSPAATVESGTQAKSVWDAIAPLLQTKDGQPLTGPPAVDKMGTVIGHMADMLEMAGENPAAVLRKIADARDTAPSSGDVAGTSTVPAETKSFWHASQRPGAEIKATDAPAQTGEVVLTEDELAAFASLRAG